MNDLNSYPDAQPDDESPEREWSEEAERLWEQGQINATQADLRTTGELGHRAIDETIRPPQEDEPSSEPVRRQTTRPKRSRPLSAKEQRQADVRRSWDEHVPERW